MVGEFGSNLNLETDQSSSLQPRQNGPPCLKFERSGFPQSKPKRLVTIGPGDLKKVPIRPCLRELKGSQCPFIPILVQY